MMSKPSIKRVVTTFILSGSSKESIKIATFKRQKTMPTFPGCWAGCSGSIEANETPWEAAHRELLEETNITIPPSKCHGMYVDVSYTSPRDGKQSIIRVYPFVAHLPNNYSLAELEMRGTEHDEVQFVSIDQLDALENTVPALAKAFHHATAGEYCTHKFSQAVLQWAQDKENGAATMAKNVLHILAAKSQDSRLDDPEDVKILRPSMVVITNVLNKCSGETPLQVLEMFQKELDRSVALAVQEISLLAEKIRRVRIATFSRSSTILAILKTLQQDDSIRGRISVVCSKSTPGDEGVYMARDLEADCIDDDEMENRFRSGLIDLLLVGSDCVMEDQFVNKVGTARLANAAVQSSCNVFCCADRFKLWNDAFPPPLEDIFECIPIKLVDKMLIPPPEGRI